MRQATTWLILLSCFSTFGYVDGRPPRITEAPSDSRISKRLEKRSHKDQSKPQRTPRGSAPIRPIGPLERDLNIKVRVYNYAAVSPADLNAAREVAQRIFSAQGVKLHWLDCARNAAELPLYRACEQVGGGPTVLALKILPRSMARQYSVAKDILGFALPTGKNGFARYANIFFHRAEELAKRKAALGRNYYPSLPVILGHVMAHELGHLLLGYQHRPSGIMTADWKKRELAKMAQGKFGFTAREGERLRGAVIERERVEAARRAGSTSGH